MRSTRTTRRREGRVSRSSIPEQQTKANELLAKQREDGEKMMREKLGGGGGERPDADADRPPAQR